MLKYITVIFLAILTVFFGQNVAYGISVADRTPQVRDAIVAAAGVETPADVTDDLMSAITSLRLGFSEITSLKAGDFAGLTALQELHLNNNQLTALPVGVFEGLTSLEVLLLNNNRLTALPVGVFEELTSLAALLLNNNQLAALPETVFSGLTSLQYLYLDSNRLRALPVSVFSGLTGLQYLYLNNNAVMPIDLTVSLERVAGRQFKAVVPTGAPFDIVLPINMSNGLISGGATVLTIPQGQVESEILTVTRTPGTLPAVTADIGVLPGLPEGHSGYAVVKSDDLPLLLIRSDGTNPIGDRTSQVRDAIVAAAGVTSPEEVTAAHLSDISSLDLSFSEITALKAGDFDDLTALEYLYLNNNPLTVLPETVFSGLTALQQLNLSTNQLAVLPETVFSGLTSLQSLYLSNNRLTLLPAGVFSGLTALQSLSLGNNAVDPVGLTVSLKRVADGQFKAVAPTGAPFDIVLPFRITNGRISSGATTLTIPQGHVESEILTVDHTFENLQLLTAALGTLPGLPEGHSGYALVQPSEQPLVLIRSDGIHPLSHRTPQVRDAIVAAAGVNAPEAVTEDHLAAITSLNLGLSNITALQAGDFDGLTALEVLLLNNNQLTALPETVFSGLMALQQLDLSMNRLTFLPAGVFGELMALQSLNVDNNAMDPVGVTISLEKVAERQFKAVMPTCAPFDIVLPIQITNGDRISGDATVLTIPKCSMESDTFSVTRTPGTIAPVTAEISTLPDLPAGHSGYALVKSGDLPLVLSGSEGIYPLSDRTRQVREAIVAAAGVNTPGAVSAAHLSAITSLGLSFSEITSLNARDFEGLTSLEVLLLNNNQLTALPATVFNGLTSLQYLYLDYNQLTVLPDSAFSELTSLQVLLLNNNQLEALPATVFNGLASLLQLDLSHNALTALPEAVFSGLTGLQHLYLNNNAMDPIGLTVSLAQVGDGQQFKAVVPMGATFDIVLPIRVANGTILGGATSLTIPQGALESDIFSVDRIPGTRPPVSADIGTLPRSPISHSGYALVKSDDLPLVLIGSAGINLLSARTPQVRDAIVVAAGVETPEEVTEAHLSAITSLDLADRSIVSLNAGDFEGLTGLTSLRLNSNQLTFLPVGVFNELTSLQRLDLNNNALTFLPIGIFGGLAALQHLNLNNNDLTALPDGVFNGLNSLQSLDLNSNALTFLPAAIFNGLNSLQSLNLSDNAVALMALTVSLEKVADGQFKAVALTGAPFDIRLPIRISNGRVSGGATSLTIPQGHVESEMLSITQTFETLMIVSADIGALPSLPEAHSGYDLVKSSDLPLALFESDRINPLSGRTPQVRDAIVVAAGVDTAADVTEAHLAAITSLGLTDRQITTLKARDFEGLMSLQVLLLNNNDLTALPEGVFSNLTALQYLNLENNQLARLPAAVFSRLTALQSLNLSNNAVDPIKMTVSLERVAEGQFKAVAPTGATFDIVLPINMSNGLISDGVTALTIPQGSVESETFSVLRTPETTAPVTADIETLLDLPVGHSGYDLVKSSDLPLVLIGGSGNPVPPPGGGNPVPPPGGGNPVPPPGGGNPVPPGNNVPIFTEGSRTSRTVVENTPPNTNIGAAVAATDADGDTLTYGLGGTDSGSFSIVSTTGQLQTRAPLDYETKNTYTVVVSVSDGAGGGDSIAVTIGVSDVNEAPVFADGETATRAVTEADTGTAGENIGSAVAATDQDGDPLTYTLSGADADLFSIVSTSGQLQTKTAIDRENKSTCTVVITATDGSLTDTVTVTINIIDSNEAPVFTDGATATRSVAENTAAGTNIGDAVGASDPDVGDTLTYSISAAKDHAAFDIVSTSGQLQTKAALNYEAKDTYTVDLVVTDAAGSTDTITVTINVTDVNDAPVFTDGATATRSVAENTAAGTNIGTAVAATDQDGDTITYTLGGADAASFDIVSTSGQLQTKSALDHETDDSYTVTVTATSNGSLTDSITVTITVSDVNEAPVFADGETATRAVTEANTGTAGENVGSPVGATDVDGDTLTYTLSGADAESFSIVSTSGQLQTKTAIDRETKSTCTVVITATDGSLTDTITVTINIIDSNEAPVFTDGATATRSVAENTAAGENIGTAVAATDQDVGDTLTYSISTGKDHAAFDIVSTSGQLQTKAALDFETKPTYTVDLVVTDAAGSTDTITVTINVTDENDAPVFTAGATATRTVAENTAASTNIGTAVAATDQDGDTITYTLGGTDKDSFSILSTSGQLQTRAALNHETDDSYTVTVTATSNGSLTDSITVTINVSDVNEAPTFANSTETRAIAENTAAGQNIGDAVAATDVDADDTLTYTLGGTDKDAFSIVSTSGQLQTKSALDHEGKASYTVTVTATDAGNLSATTTVTISVSDVNDAPVFTAGASTTLSVAENTAAGQNIGTAVGATDQDVPANTLTYSLSGADAASFDIVETSGQLQTKAALDYETDDTYAVTVSVSDGSGGTDSIAVTIGVTDANDAPVFTAGATATRTVAENTAAGTDIGDALVATDQDRIPDPNNEGQFLSKDTLTYSLGGDDADDFGIVSTSGQLQTKSALDFETTTSYSVTVSVSDGEGGSDSIDVTISVTNEDENNAPVFADGTSTTRTVAENTAASTNIGTAVAATDADGDTITYSLSGDDADDFGIVSTSGQLQTKSALDFETTTSYSVTVTADDSNGGSTEIAVTISVTNVNETPSFTDGDTATRSVAENTAANTNIGAALGATDPEGDTLTYSLSLNTADDFSIVSTSGQLQTKSALDYETQTSYTVTVIATESTGEDTFSDSIDVTINVTNAVDEVPTFTEGATTTRSVAENTAAGTNIGDPVAATADADDTLTYTLGGTDAASFGIVSTSGQLQTKAALDFETDASYAVTVTVTDDDSETDSIDVTISVTNVNEAPSFASSTVTRTVAENTAAGTDIGDAVGATDVDAADTLTYTLGGTDKNSFDIVSTSGQLQTKSALDFETDDSYTVTVTATDGDSLSATTTVTIGVTDANDAPVFTAGATATRSIAENTAAGTDIGDALVATDEDRIPDPNNDGQFLAKDTLTYSLGGDDADDFSIVSTSGQLQTKSALDFETTTSYSVTVSVSDGAGGSDSIDVTISVTNEVENNAPVFAAGAKTTRTVAENTAAKTNIGAAVTATDADGDTIAYSLSRTHWDLFSIVSTSGQLQTKAALNFETQASYSVTVTATDTNGGSTDIAVTITVTNVNEAPSFSEGDAATRTVLENTTANTDITRALAIDPEGDTLTYTLGGADADDFSINSGTGQLKTRVVLDYETKPSYTVKVTATESTGSDSFSDSITVTINVTNSFDDPPSFTDGTSTTRSVAENTAASTNIGDPVAATADADDTLTYTLGGTDAASFGIVSTSGQLQTKAALNYETDASYEVTVSVADEDSDTDSIAVTISVTNVNEAPSFASSTATRSIAENTAAGQNIGDAVVATDVDAGDTLTYSLGGTDKDSFSIVSTSGQLQTKSALDYETDDSYTVTVTATDAGNLSATTTVTISVTDEVENGAPTFADGATATRSVVENMAAGTNIGSAVAATDPDGDTLTYMLSGTHAASFNIVDTSGQLQTKAALNHETQASYSVKVSVSDGSLTDDIAVTINVIDANEAPTFTAGATATRAVAENTAASKNIGTAVVATDPDGDTLTYSLGGTDKDSFDIVSTSGQLQTKAALNYETRTSYTVKITASDEVFTDSITVTINVTNVNEAPTFASTTATRAVAENTAGDTNIGTVFTATDVDAGTTLAYTLSGDDASLFRIVSTSGQLQVGKNTVLNYEKTSSYSVTVTASDGSLTDDIAVTINVTDVNEPPQFRGLGTSRDLSVAEDAVLGTNIGAPVTATDPEGATITHSLGGMDAASFRIVPTTGQLRTRVLLDYEAKNTYTVTVTADDGSLTQSILITIRVTDVAEIDPPLSERTRQVREAIVAAVPGVNNAEDVTHVHLAAITSLSMNSKNITSLKTGDFNGLTSLTELHLSGNSISDISTLDNLTSLTELRLHANSISDISALDDLTKLQTLHLSSNSISNISALDDLTSLTELHLSGNSISNISALDDLTKLQTLYLIYNSIRDVSALEDLTALTTLRLRGNPIIDYGPLRRLKTANSNVNIDIDTDNNPPVFLNGTSTTRSVAENTVAGQNIERAVAASDQDGDTLTYSLGGTDAASFSIVRTSGQLQTKAPLDYETKTSYAVTVDVSDGNDGLDRIIITINVTDVDNENAPAAPSVETPPVIPENTALLTNYPNPFNPETWIPYQLATPADVRLTIYDGRGVVVRELRLGHRPAGVYLSRSRAIHWDGRNMLGEKVATGVYFYTLKAGDYTATRKLLIRK